jgi:hypothetical protein
MKQVTILIAGAAVLASCNKGPEVSLKNATGNQVTEAVKQSGVMTSDSMVQPGLWESKVTIQDLNFPGMPAQYLDRMKQSIAAHRNDTNKHCIKPEDVKRPKEDFFGADKNCKYDHFTMGGGKIDVAMVCHEEDTTNNMNVTGTYTPTSYSIDTAMNGSGGHQNGMTMKMHVDARRVGECTGKDDED